LIEKRGKLLPPREDSARETLKGGRSELRRLERSTEEKFGREKERIKERGGFLLVHIR